MRLELFKPVEFLKLPPEEAARLQAYIEEMWERPQTYALYADHPEIPFPLELCCQISKRPSLFPLIIDGKVYDLNELVKLRITKGKWTLDGETAFDFVKIELGHEVAARLQEYYERVIEPAFVSVSEIDQFAKEKFSKDDAVKAAVFLTIVEAFKKNDFSATLLNRILGGFPREVRVGLFQGGYVYSSRSERLILELYEALGVSGVTVAAIIDGRFESVDADIIAINDKRLAKKQMLLARDKYVETLEMTRLFFRKLADTKSVCNTKNLEPLKNEFFSALREMLDNMFRKIRFAERVMSETDRKKEITAEKLAGFFLNFDSKGVFLKGDFRRPDLEDVGHHARMFLLKFPRAPASAVDAGRLIEALESTAAAP